MITISLYGIKIFALIGLYPQEKINGNLFEVDVAIQSKPDAPFIDYVVIRKLVDQSFLKEYELLEEIGNHLIQSLKKKFPFAENYKVNIRKMNPPMDGETNYAQVSIEL